jgi:hypothetical protein
MSDICPTVLIKTATGPARLNEADFDPAKHVLCDADGKPVAATKPGDQDPGDAFVAMTVAQLKELAAERGIDLGEATKKADIIAVLAATKPGDQE